jgi:hypothetical protein
VNGRPFLTPTVSAASAAVVNSKRRRIALLLVLGLVALVAFKPTRVGLQALILVPSLFDAPVRPLELVSTEPTLLTVPYRPDRPTDLSDLWLPSGAGPSGRVGGVVLVFGVNNPGRGHPAVVRVSRALARTGVAVFVPDSATLTAGRLDPVEIDGIVHAFETFRARSEIDPARVGIVGFSVGGSLALLAAAQSRIAEDISFVNAFGAYGDASGYLANVASHTYELEGQHIPWPPSPLAREVLTRLVLEQLDAPGDRGLLAGLLEAAAQSGGRPVADPALDARLSPSGRAVYELVTASDLPAARTAVERLSPHSQELLDDLSPLGHLDGLRTDVYLMHEQNDFHIPFVESRLLAAELAARGRLARHSEFRLFTHVQPDQIDPIAAAPELWKLAWHMHAMLVETL